MLGELRLNAAKRAAPFSLPQLLEVDRLDTGLTPRALNEIHKVFPHHTLQKFVPLSSEAVDVPMLAEPHCSDDLALAAVSTYVVPAHIDAPSVLSMEVGIEADVEVFDALALLQSVTTMPFPAVHDMIDLLGKNVRIVGRTAADDAASEQPSLLPSLGSAAATACKHGLPRGSCETCRRERTAKQKKPPTKEKGVSIADVLELLWLYLQPPLDPKTFTSVFPFPDGKKLVPYQVQGIEFLVERRGALLADEMGLGKTAQAIVAARVLLRKASVIRILTVAPKSVLINWQREWDLWAQREVRVQVVDGTKEQRAQQWEVPAHVWVVSYETLREDLPKVQQLAEFELVILDEAAKVKNPNARVTRAVRGLPRRRCWALTATPLENKPDDLASILKLVAVDATVAAHVKRCIDALALWEWRSPEEREELMRPLMLRRRQEDVLDLPPVVEEERWLRLTPEQRVAYNAALNEAQEEIRDLGENVTKVHVFARFQKLKQLCNFDPETGSSAKADYLTEHLREIAPEDKILIFSQYPGVSLPSLKEGLERDFQMLDIYDGKLGTGRREELLKTFEDDSSFRVLLMGLKAGGVGLNLQKANHVILFDHWWNPATHKQALGRVLRIGQGKTVFNTSLFTIDTVEEGIYENLQGKEALFKAYVEDPSEAQSEVEEKLTLEDLLEVMGLPLPEQRARQEKMDSRESGNDGSRLGHSHRADEGLGASRAPRWSGPWDKQRLRELSPSGFEELVARLYQAMGYRADKTRDSRDGGVDVVAERQAIGAREKRLIQCKHTESESVVGVPVVRQLAGVLGSKPDATNAVVVTNGTFSKSAWQEFRDSRVELVDDKRLLYLLERYPPT